jgi:hypothetical protein
MSVEGDNLPMTEDTIASVRVSWLVGLRQVGSS